MKIFEFASQQLKIPLFFEFQKVESVEKSEAYSFLKELAHYPELMKISGDFISDLNVAQNNPEKWFLKNFAREKRRDEWIRGRQLVLKLWKQGLKELSVSHSAQHILVCGTPQFSIGVDFERSSRSIEERVFNRISSLQERDLGLTPLALWTIKEAAFKASHSAIKTVGEVEIISSFEQKNKTNDSQEDSFFYGEVKWKSSKDSEDLKRSKAFYWVSSDPQWTVSIVVQKNL